MDQATAMLPLTPPKRRRQLSAQDWENQRSTFQQLYSKDDLPLDEVMRVMEREHGFRATERQYKRRISQWHLDKNVKDNEMQFIIRKQKKRKVLEDKDTAFRVRSRYVEPEKIDSSRQQEDVGRYVSVTTKSGCSYYTPVGEGPPTPNVPYAEHLDGQSPAAIVGSLNDYEYTSTPTDLLFDKTPTPLPGSPAYYDLAHSVFNLFAAQIPAFAPSPNSNQPELPQDVHQPQNTHTGTLPTMYMQPTYLEETNVHTDLNILGSETHNDSRVIEEVRSSSGAEVRSNDTALLGGFIVKQDAVDSDATSLKQSDGRSWKKSQTERRGSGDEATSKKILGRPKVDTADDNAADCRRAKIRLAQRTYRLRKETTVSSLKERVSELQSAIEDVNKSFLKFNDNVMSSGIIQMRPDLGWDLKETTKQFLMLTRIANLDQESGIRIPPAPEKSKPDPWVYQIVHEEYPLNENGKRFSKLSPILEPQHDGFWRGWDGTDASRGPESTTPEDEFGSIHPPQQFPAGVPSLDRYTCGFDSQQAATSIPWTFSFQETTFARRLHRAAIERGYYLFLSPNSPPSDVTCVFEFCFTFNDRDETLQRLRGILMRSTKESPENPEVPILHIGGSGLHYPRKNVPRNPETMTDLMAPVRSIGPMALTICQGCEGEGHHAGDDDQPYGP
ncbi:hypothetical protein GP486_003241 [Trichoglossum hirsutum]|uniref:Clr5 domain-containing protein n=1 Tax=Trichoglossum hirsutum TaxID=265104 RepID=A0A9P8LDA8_9PEZI|nr:hypothetical protein GP486_003241 [Trichoglossum hirsutum]